MNDYRSEYDGWTRIRADSGAIESVAPNDMAPGYQMVAGPGSRRGQKYVSASGGGVANEGEQRLPMVSNNRVTTEKMAVGSRDTHVTERWRDVRRWQPWGVWSWRRNHPEFTHRRGDSIHQRKRCVLDGHVDTTRSDICQSRVGFSEAGPTVNGFCGGQLSHQQRMMNRMKEFPRWFP